MCERMAGPPPPKRLRISELNPHLLCALCGGYLIDATTIIECLHSFCKTCILRYLETSNYCPICEVLIHKTRPWQNIRLDHSLQNAVYKMVPGLFQSEMKRRREFYDRQNKQDKRGRPISHPEGELGDRIIFSQDEEFSISIEFSPDGKPVKEIKPAKSLKRPRSNCQQDKRYLKCPAGLRIQHLKKFIRSKFSLPQNIEIDLFYEKEPLSDTYSLMDVAYIYLWKRDCVLRLFYSFYEIPSKVRKVETATTVTETISKKNKIKDKNDEKAEKRKGDKKSKNKKEKSRDRKEGRMSGKRKVSVEGATTAGITSPSKPADTTSESSISSQNLKRKHSDAVVSADTNCVPKFDKHCVSSAVSEGNSHREQFVTYAQAKQKPPSEKTSYSIITQPSTKESTKSSKNSHDSKASLKLLIKSSEVKDSKRSSSEITVEMSDKKRQNGETSLISKSNLFERMDSLTKSSSVDKKLTHVTPLPTVHSSQSHKLSSNDSKAKVKDVKCDIKVDINIEKPKTTTEQASQARDHLKAEKKSANNLMHPSAPQTVDTKQNQPDCKARAPVSQSMDMKESHLVSKQTKTEAMLGSAETNAANMDIEKAASDTKKVIQLSTADRKSEIATNAITDSLNTKQTQPVSMVENGDRPQPDIKYSTPKTEQLDQKVAESSSSKPPINDWKQSVDMTKSEHDTKPIAFDSKYATDPKPDSELCLTPSKKNAPNSVSDKIQVPVKESAPPERVKPKTETCESLSKTEKEIIQPKDLSFHCKDESVSQPNKEKCKVENVKLSCTSLTPKRPSDTNQSSASPTSDCKPALLTSDDSKANSNSSTLNANTAPSRIASTAPAKSPLTTKQLTATTSSESLVASPKTLTTAAVTRSSSSCLSTSYSIASIVSVCTVAPSRVTVSPASRAGSTVSDSTLVTTLATNISPVSASRAKVSSHLTSTSVSLSVSSATGLSTSVAVSFSSSKARDLSSSSKPKDTSAIVGMSNSQVKPSESSETSSFATTTPSFVQSKVSSVSSTAATITASSTTPYAAATVKNGGSSDKTVNANNTFLNIPSTETSTLLASQAGNRSRTPDVPVPKLTIPKEAVKLDNFLFDTKPSEKESPTSSISPRSKEPSSSERPSPKSPSKARAHSPADSPSKGSELHITAIHQLPKTISQTSKYSMARPVGNSSSSSTKSSNSIIQTTKISTLIPKSSSISSKSGTYSKAFSYPSTINNVPSSRSFLHSSLPSHLPRPDLSSVINGSAVYERGMLGKAPLLPLPPSSSSASSSTTIASSPSSSSSHHKTSSSKHSPKEGEGKTEKSPKHKTIPPLSIPKSCLISTTLKLQRSPGSTDHYIFAPLSHYSPTSHHNGERSKSKESKHNGSRTPTSPPTPTKDSVFIGERQRVPTIKISDINRNPIIVESGASSGGGSGGSSSSSNHHHQSQYRSYSHGSSRSSTSENGSARTLSRGGSDSNSPTGSSSSSGRSPVRDTRRPSDSEVLLSQHWHGYSAADLLFNGFKLPPHPRFHDLHYDTDAMPLDYSQSSSKS